MLSSVDQWICRHCEWANMYVRVRCRNQNCRQPRTPEQEQQAEKLGYKAKAEAPEDAA